VGTPLAFRFEPLGIVNASKDPCASFEIDGRLVSVGDDEAAVFGIWSDVRAQRGQLLVQPTWAVDPGAACYQPNGRSNIRIPVHVTSSLLRRLHNGRDENGAIDLTFRMVVVAAKVVRQGPHMEEVFTSVPFRLDVNVSGVGGGDSLRVTRDEWLRLLGALGYDEIEVFELSKRSLVEHEELRRGLEHVRRAETHRRNGYARETLAACREAFEASGTGADGDARSRWERLWQCALPRQEDAPKREQLDALIKALTNYLQAGRHSKPPFPSVDDADALLALRITLALFEYLGDRLPILPAPIR
jgi:hypothetical protein